MKPIQMSREFQDKLLADFQHFLSTTRTIDATLTYRFDMEKAVDARIPILYWTADAYLKMRTLVLEAKEEIAWHGLVRKQQDDTYLVYDIIVYPQLVTGVAANTDQAAYETWVSELDDDTFHNLRMQGHSHVSMGVNPSTTDHNLYTTMLASLTRIPFYIFMITNKSGDMFVLFYDFEQNLIFETKEVLSEVLLESGTSLTDWQKNAVTCVHSAVQPATVKTTPQLGGRGVSNDWHWTKEERERWREQYGYFAGGDT